MQVDLRSRFPISLNLPDANTNLFGDAAEAVRREFRNSIRWKRLRCRKVSPLTEESGDAIFVIEVGHSIEFDWTWEGAIAFRPSDLSGFTGEIDTTEDFLASSSGNDAGDTRAAVWAGEVVEVDETNGRLFVSVPDPEHPPCTGSFYVRPFEFLAFLHSVYCHSSRENFRSHLPGRLEACRGDIHPLITSAINCGLTELGHVWKHSWGILWGPPGTGKTFTIGRQVAACLKDRSERILVVSTTNRATDEAALSIGRASRFTSNSAIDEGRLLRIGKSAGYSRFQKYGLEEMLRGTETEILRQITALSQQLHSAHTHEQRALYRKQIQELRRLMKDSAFIIFTSPEVQVVISTAFKAIAFINDPNIKALVGNSEAPFTTVIIDEAGLISRTATAVLSLLASRRVLLVGDSRQLAPISRISRVLPTSQSTWIASSALSHLQRIQQAGPAVHLLREQHRMHSEISRVVSEYQYDGELGDAPEVINRDFTLPPLLQNQPRAIWYVLDEDGADLPTIRAERGPGNRSWIRPATRSVLMKFFSDPAIRQTPGLFLSPFVAQAKDITRFFAEENLSAWSAATVHSQQGTEADVVIFDTVNAGSCGWSYDEWKRLVNVGVSRAREFVMLLASRAEMNEPYLKPLLRSLAPHVLYKSGRNVAFRTVPQQTVFEVPIEIAANPDLLGNQLSRRKALRPVMSAEQQRLSGLNLDGKPRLVRGVAGSGKTVVLAHWLQQTVKNLSNKPDAKVWAVYANRALEGLIRDIVEEAWIASEGECQFPWEKVSLLHVKDILEPRLKEVGLNWIALNREDPRKYDWNKLSEIYLQRRPAEQIGHCCHGMFIDEAQDMGPSTLKLLSALVEQSDTDDPQSRAVNIFYDNAQNIYGRSTPTWSSIGLGMRGRSTVMKESFRSTKPITEFALNVLYRLQPPDSGPLGSDPEHKELIERALIERGTRDGEAWWNVRYNQVDGPMPIFKKYPNLDQQVDALGDQIVGWIREEGVKPSDICVLYNGKDIRRRISTQIPAKLQAIGAHLLVQTNQVFNRDDRTVLATTPHSFKGYDSEVVVIAGVEQFVAKEKRIQPKSPLVTATNDGKTILANNLYVAMTRARSILAIYAKATNNNPASHLLSVIETCLDTVLDRPKIDREISHLDDLEELIERIGSEHRDWMKQLWRDYSVVQEPILASDGEILAEPVFWFNKNGHVVACFGSDESGAHTRYKLEDAGIEIIYPGKNAN